MRRIIFLDIDGVLNPRWWENKFYKTHLGVKGQFPGISQMKGMMVIMNLQAIEYMKREEIINNILIPSLQRLYEVDYFNVSNGASERNICARLAHHMEYIMHEHENYKGYFADVEYNRKNDGTGKCYDSSFASS